MARTRTDYEQRRMLRLKADPVLYAAYLARKCREASARAKKPEGREYERARKAAWRARNLDNARRIRAAGHAVENAVERGKLVKVTACQHCSTDKRRIEAHHYKGYEREHWLDVEWLCPPCHRKADRGLS